MENLKRLFTAISNILLYSLIFSLSAHLFLTKEYETVYSVFLILLCLFRAIVLVFLFADIMKPCKNEATRNVRRKNR